MENTDIPFLLSKNVDLEYLVSKQDESKFGKAVTQLKALKALRKLLNDNVTQTSFVPNSVTKAINTLIAQRSQLVLNELSSMSLVAISDEDIACVNRLLTS